MAVQCKDGKYPYLDPTNFRIGVAKNTPTIDKFLTQKSGKAPFVPKKK